MKQTARAVPCSTAVCGVVLLRNDGAALLQLRDNRPDIQDPGLWVFPGGHLEPGETFESGANREFTEETSYVCGELNWLATFSARAIGYSEDYDVTFFWSRFDARQPFECLEGQQLRFVMREEIDSMARREYLTQVWDLALAASGTDRKRGTE